MQLKINLLVIISVIISTSAKSQNATKHYKDIHKSDIVFLEDTVFKKGVPYCLLLEMTTKNSKPDYRVCNLNRALIMELKYFVPDKISNVGYYYLSFTKTGDLVNLQTNDEKELPALIVKNNLVSDGAISDVSEEQMLSLYKSENDILYFDGIIYKGGKPYCKLVEIQINSYHPDYSVRNMQDQELMHLKFITLVSGYGPGSYHLNFPDGNSVKLRTNDEKNIPGIVVQNDLISNGEVPVEKEQAFIKANGGSFYQTTPTTPIDSLNHK